MQHNKAQICDLIEFVVNILEARGLRLGGLYRRYWFLVAAFTTIKMRLYPEKAKQMDEMAGAKLTSLLYKILASQAPVPESMTQHVQSDLLGLPHAHASSALFEESPLVSLPVDVVEWLIGVGQELMICIECIGF